MRCPPIRLHRPGFRLSSRLMSGPSGVQPSRVRSPWLVVRVQRPALCRPPVRCPAVCCPPPSVRSRPSPHLRRWRWDQAEAAGQPSPQQPVEVRWAAATSGAGSTTEEPWGGRRRQARAVVSRGVGSGPGPGVVGGAAAAPRARCATRQARPALERPWLAAAPWAGAGPARALAAPAAWLPSSGWVGDHGEWWSGRRPVGVAARSGCRRAGGCGPSAAQGGRGHSWLVAGSAVTWGDGWWACQDLNLGPHPYQQSSAYRYATLRFRRSPPTVRSEVMRSCRQARQYTEALPW
jgi:hypothetical protein